MATRYLSVKEVGSILKIDKKTVYKLIYSGEIPGHFKLGSMHFIDEEEFRAGLKQRATTPKQTSFKVQQNRTSDKHGLLK